MSIRLIAIDIDGTLLPSTGAGVSERNCAALRAAQRAGIEIVIATGRRQAFASPHITGMGLSSESVIISSNGAVMRRLDGQLMERCFLSVEASRRLCGELRDYGTVVFTFDREGRDGLVIENLKKVHARIQMWVDANLRYLSEVQPIERAFDLGEAPIQGMVCGTIEQMREAEARLLSCGMDQQIGMQRTEYAERDLSILDLLPWGVSKGTALARLAELRNLDRDEIMAIGDNWNDREMLEYAGRAVLMGNAGEEMLEIARVQGWELAGTNDEDGVAEVIEELLLEPPLAAEHDAGRNRGATGRGTTVVEWAQ